MSLIKKIAASVALAWVCVLQSTSHAQQAPFTPNTTVVRDHAHYRAQADGRYTLEKDLDIRLNTEQAVQQMGHIPLAYSSALQTMDVLEAYVLTPEGKRVEVRTDGIREQLFPASTGALMFDDRKVKTVIFPSLQMGSHVVFRMRMTMNTPLFPGQFFEFQGAGPHADHTSFQVTVQAPADMKLNVAANLMEGGEETSDNPQMRQWRWHRKNIPAVAPESGAPSAHERMPHVALSTFDDVSHIGRAYAERASDKLRVTPDIQKLADQITRGETDRRAQAALLYQWVSHKIRYVAIHLGFGGVVPHEADAVLKAGYGDCKDKTTLLQALLAAKGIVSRTVLVNATDVYWMPSLAMPTTVFNHAITYLPEWDLFADSTPGKAMFGVLSSSLAGKQALVVGALGEPSQMKVLPHHTPDNNVVNIRTVMVLDSAGKITGSSTTESKGSADLIARQVFSSFPPGVEAQVASRLLAATGQDGSGNLQYDGAEDVAKPFIFKMHFNLPDYVETASPGAFMLPVGLRGLVNTSNVFKAFGPTERKLPMIWGGWTHHGAHHFEVARRDAGQVHAHTRQHHPCVGQLRVELESRGADAHDPTELDDVSTPSRYFGGGLSGFAKNGRSSGA